jgi:hypothetical protein
VKPWDRIKSSTDKRLVINKKCPKSHKRKVGYINGPSEREVGDKLFPQLIVFIFKSE